MEETIIGHLLFCWFGCSSSFIVGRFTRGSLRLASWTGSGSPLYSLRFKTSPYPIFENIFDVLSMWFYPTAPNRLHLFGGLEWGRREESPNRVCRCQSVDWLGPPVKGGPVSVSDRDCKHKTIQSPSKKCTFLKNFLKCLKIRPFLMFKLQIFVIFRF